MNKKTDFNKEIALLLVQLCVESYNHVDTYGRGIAKYNMELITPLNNKKSDIQGFIAKKNNDLYIVFRGTSDLRDGLRDIDFELVNYPSSKSLFSKPKVHKGFYTGYLSVKDDIVKTLNKTKYESLYVTGHSMGAGIAVLCSFDLTMQFGYDGKTILYTFGCPEIGNDPFVKRFKRTIKTSFRVVNDEDIIPKINIPGVTHVPTLVLKNGKKLNVNPRILTK